MLGLEMCIVFLAVRAHPLYSLVVLANRDEALARPTAAMHGSRSATVLVVDNQARARLWEKEYGGATQSFEISPTSTSSPVFEEPSPRGRNRLRDS